MLLALLGYPLALSARFCNTQERQRTITDV